MASLYNRVRVQTPTTGTGTLSIGPPIDGWLDFGEAPVTDGATVSYLLEEGNNVEWGRGVYDLTAGTLTRTVTRSKTVAGVVGTDLLSLGGGAELSITALAADFNEVDGDFVPDTDDGSSLGTLSLKWSDLFLASGAVINFDEGDITVTHSANGLDFAGGAFRFPNTGLQAYDTDGSHVLTFRPGSNLTADRTLNFTTGDADRTVTLSGNPTLDDWFDQSVKQAASPTFAGATVNGNISVTGTVDGRDVSNDGAAQDAHIADTDNPHSVTPDQLSLGTGDSPQFTAVNVGHASDTTLARASAGDLNVEGNLIYRAGGTDVPIADGGTGASDASGARTNLDLNSATELASTANGNGASLVGIEDSAGKFTAGDVEGALAELASPTVGDAMGITGIQANRYYSAHRLDTSTTLAVTADRLYGAVFSLLGDATFTRIGIEVTSGAGTNARLGIYSLDGGDHSASALLVDAGLVDTSTTGEKEATISQALTAGWYILAVVFDDTPTVISTNVNISTNRIALGNSGVSSGLDEFHIRTAHTFGTLPSTFGAPTYVAPGASSIPTIWLRVV